MMTNGVASGFYVRRCSFFVLLPLLLILGVLSCQRENLPPSAVLTVFPPIGDSTLVFEFKASKTTDDRNYPLALQFRWDFDGDGVWDTDYLTYNTIGHRYSRSGTYQATLEVKDLDGLTAIARDTVVVFGENRAIDTLTDPRDGNQYRIVKIGKQWWMGENLRYGQVIPTDREQTNNDTVEMYRITHCPSRDSIGGVYSWLEAMNYKPDDPRGICPEGWHIPTRSDWDTLFEPFPDFYSQKYYGKNGLSNLNLDLNNGGDKQQYGYFEANCYTRHGFWSSSYRLEDYSYKPYMVEFNHDDIGIFRGFWAKGQGLLKYYSVRCVKDDF